MHAAHGQGCARYMITQLHVDTCNQQYVQARVQARYLPGVTVQRATIPIGGIYGYQLEASCP